MTTSEYKNSIRDLLDETTLNPGTHFLRARVRARAMSQDYSLVKDTLLDPELNLGQAEKVAEFIFSQSSFFASG